MAIVGLAAALASALAGAGPTGADPKAAPVDLRAGQLAASSPAEQPDGQHLGQISGWLTEAWVTAPALMIGVAVVVALPVLALFGTLWHRTPEGEQRTTLVSRSRRGTRGRSQSGRDDEDELGVARPARAWIEVEGDEPRPIGRGMLRLGREDDNDICLTDKTVHRYHAVIHRTADAEFRITDLSSADGNGVLVNGQRTAEARLRDGDTVQLGQAILKFVEKPA